MSSSHADAQAVAPFLGFHVLAAVLVRSTIDMVISSRKQDRDGRCGTLCGAKTRRTLRNKRGLQEYRAVADEGHAERSGDTDVEDPDGRGDGSDGSSSSTSERDRSEEEE